MVLTHLGRGRNRKEHTTVSQAGLCVVAHQLIAVRRNPDTRVLWCLAHVSSISDGPTGVRMCTRTRYREPSRSEGRTPTGWPLTGVSRQIPH